ncbi:hypothetical protein OE88DRAFT_1668735 [Heliocybe sulcata]|uniref:Uncharacterized protein n=1 Tax=Heliocybe sulcata TaxID=5364 RepID=A0A5C3MMF3_9AGAM|nr:hypothetical protein OE88DRAFT_1668735 [Heliocybe sulcata]
MRLIDDYLFITTDLLKAKHFVQMMSEGEFMHPSQSGADSRSHRPSGLWMLHSSREIVDELRLRLVRHEHCRGRSASLSMVWIPY